MALANVPQDESLSVVTARKIIPEGKSKKKKRGIGKNKGPKTIVKQIDDKLQLKGATGATPSIFNMMIT